MRQFFVLVLSYIAAAPLTSRISLDLTKTEWTSAYTYVWIIVGYLCWILAIMILAVITNTLDQKGK